LKLGHGARCRDWRDTMEDSNVQAFPDWPLKGPRTASWCIDYLNKQPGGPQDHHQLWKTQSKIQNSDWGISEHDTLMQILQHASSYDQLDVCNLASFEVLLRRAQTIEYCYIEKSREISNVGQGKFGPRLSFEEQTAFMGVVRSDMYMVAPALLSHIKDTVKEDAELSKNLRLAREERANANKAGNKNKNKKGDDE
jgi:hypothetical protein